MQLEQQQSYRLFSSSIRSDETRKTYTLLLKKFIEYLGEDEDVLLGNDAKQIERKIIDYIINLKEHGKQKVNHSILFALSLLGLILSSCSPFVFAIGTVNDTFNIDVKLIKDKLFSDDNWFQLPEDYQLNVSNSSIICPSNNCKSNLKFGNGSTSTLVLNEGTNSMVIIGDFRLVDAQSNGHLTPKKQNLIEQMTYNWGCQFSDIQEDTKSKTTKYICSNPDNEDIIRKFNSTHYPYKITASFELPSRHLVLNATEVHDNPYLFFSGHLVFKNEDGQIVVK